MGIMIDITDPKRAEEASAKLEVDPRATRHIIRGDNTPLQQILWNLVSNAIRFTPLHGAGW
jgi:signal transduction histidine kinase